MTEINRSSSRGFSANMLQKCTQIPGLEAGEDLQKMDACRIWATDGKVYRATSGCVVTQTYTSGSTTANFSTSLYAGFVPYAYKSGEIVTLVRGGVGGDYSSGMTPGNPLFIAATSGSLSSGSAVVNGDKPVAQVLTATKILVL